jgi:hypothetical protein
MNPVAFSVKGFRCPSLAFSAASYKFPVFSLGCFDLIPKVDIYSQLFGKDDPDEDVSPDTEDPEHTAEAGEEALHHEAKEGFDGGIDRKSTRSWAEETDFNPEKLFHKFFQDDIKYLLSMETLWKKRRPPVPLDWDTLPDKGKMKYCIDFKILLN